MSTSVTLAVSGGYFAFPESHFSFPFPLYHAHARAIHHLAFSLALSGGKTGRYAWTRHHISVPLPLALPLSVAHHVGMEGVFSLTLFAIFLPVSLPFWG